MFSNGNVDEAFSNVTSIETSKKVLIDTSNVTQFEEMFKGCKSLTNSGLQEFINKFDTSSAVNMCAMFSHNAYLTELDLSRFDTSNVTDMSWMFEYDSKLIDVDLGGKFDTSSVAGSKENQGFAGMFIECSSIKVLDLMNFNTSKVKSMWQMFSGCTSLEKIYTSDKFVTTALSTSNAFYKIDLFVNCTELKGDNGTAFATSQVTDSSYAHIDGGTSNPGYFSNSTNYTLTLNANGGKFTTDKDIKTYTCKNKVKLKFSDIPVCEGKFFAGWSVSESSANPQYYNGETVVFTNNITLYAVWHDKLTTTLMVGKNVYSTISDYREVAEHIRFLYLENIPEESIYIGNLDVNNNGIVVAYYNDSIKTVYFALSDNDYNKIVFNEDSSHMFSNGNTASTAFNKLKTIDIDEGIEIDTSKVKDFSEIFKYNQSLEQESLQEFINRFDTSSVTNMCAMFEYLTISSIDLSNFNTDNVTDMSWMFHGASLTSIEFGNNFNTSKVTKFDGMFQALKSMVNLDISIIKVKSGATINYMFGLCPILERIYVAEDSGFENSGNGIRVFENDTSLVGGTGENETKYTSSEISRTYARISTKDAPGYFTSINEK